MGVAATAIVAAVPLHQPTRVLVWPLTVAGSSLPSAPASSGMVIVAEGVVNRHFWATVALMVTVPVTSCAEAAAGMAARIVAAVSKRLIVFLLIEGRLSAGRDRDQDRAGIAARLEQIGGIHRGAGRHGDRDVAGGVEEMAGERLGRRARGGGKIDRRRAAGGRLVGGQGRRIIDAVGIA